MFRCCHFILILLVALSSSGIHGQTLTARALSIDDGLSLSSVDDILKGPKGYYWFATQDGLNRFDGYDFEVFDSENSAVLQSTFITRLVTLDKDHILVGTANGLYVFNTNSDELKPVLTEQMSGLIVDDIQVTDDFVVISASERLFLLTKDLSIHPSYVDINIEPIKSGRVLFEYKGSLYYVSENDLLRPLFNNQPLPACLYLGQWHIR